MQQQYDENTQRLAVQRRYPEDDKWIAEHDLEMAMFHPSQIHVTGFDPRIDCYRSKLYGVKYNAKAEKHYYIDVKLGPEDGFKRHLQCRTVGLPLTLHKLLGHKIIRSTRPFSFLRTQFVPPIVGRAKRTQRDLENHPENPDRNGYIGDAQRYLLRSKELRHLRMQQYARYFSEASKAKFEARTVEDTQDEQKKKQEYIELYDPPHHRHFDKMTSLMKMGTTFKS